MLTIDNISCSRGGRKLFSNLGFTLGEGCLLVIRGENGCGKTTLLETIACLRKPDEGELLYLEKSISLKNNYEYCEIMQYIGHRSAIKNQLSVFENLEFWAKIKNNQVLVNAAIAFFGLYEYREFLCASLSAGYKKRVSLAKLMLTNSKIWLLDEPFVNLDEEGRGILANLISARLATGGVAIITAHDEIPFENYAQINLQEFK